MKFEVLWCAAAKGFENRLRCKYQANKSNNVGATEMILHTSLRKQQIVDKDLYIVYNKTTKYR